MFKDADLRAYLLGQSIEADAERIEIQALDDEDCFTTLGSVEDDLFDDHARGMLADDELQRFLARYGGERGRLQVARALVARGARPRAGFPPDAFKYWMVAAAAACLAGIAASVGVRSRPARPQTPAAVAVPPVTPAAPVPVALLLTLGTSRSAAPPPEVRLPVSASVLQLHVRLDPADTFDSYAMELRSDHDVVVWRGDAIQASSAGGDLTVAVDIPAASLQESSYELTVRGSSAGSRPEVLGFAAVRVRR